MAVIFGARTTTAEDERAGGRAWRNLIVAGCLLICSFGKVFADGPPDPGGGPTNMLLDSWSFSDTNGFSSDLGYKPLSYTNLSVSDLGDGTAVVIDSPFPSWLQFNVFEIGATNLTLTQGSLLMWFAPDWAGTNAGGTGPLEWARLIEVGSYTDDASVGWWSLYVNPQGTQIYFSGQGNDGTSTTFLSAPINWSTNYWHLIGLTYSTNSSLYIDGELVTNGSPVTCGPDYAVQNDGGFFIGSDNTGVAQARGIFDEISTYANPLDAGFIFESYWYGSAPYYLNPENRANLTSAPSYSTNSPTFSAINGAGNLTNAVTNTVGCVTSSNIWLTNVVVTMATNHTMSVTFTIAGGSNGVPYDLFANSALIFSSDTNTAWAWMGQGYHCVTYTLPNLTNNTCFLILGQPTDTDHDGLTDAYERLVSKTDPLNPDTDGDGIPDGWEIVWKLNPLVNDSGQTSQRSNFSYNPVGWLNALAGTRAETIGLDAEGNVQSAH